MRLPLPTLGAVPAEAGGATDGAAGGAAGEYEWCFDAGSGPVARGAVRACRRPFDGWSKSAAYEAGLAAMLNRMAQNSGESGPDGGGGGGGGGNGARVGGAGAGAGVSVRVGGGAAGCRNVGGPSASSPSASSPSAPPCQLARGARVRLCGLVARAELNGCIGEVVGPMAEGGRIPVRILLPAELAGQGVKLKPANIQPE